MSVLDLGTSVSVKRVDRLFAATSWRVVMSRSLSSTSLATLAEALGFGRCKYLLDGLKCLVSDVVELLQVLLCKFLTVQIVQWEA
jgi:hypothetical protein